MPTEPTAPENAAADHARPNILIYLVDQMQAQTLAPDHPCRTPNLEHLAAEGVRFTHCFTPAPHCCPARATFMTGLYPSRHGVFNNVDTATAFQKGLNPGVRLFSDELKDAGYDLAYAGKWHVSNEETPADRGWRELTPHHIRPLYPSPEEVRNTPNEPADEAIGRPRPLGHVRRPGYPDSPIQGEVIDDYRDTPYFKSAIAPTLDEISRLAQHDQPWALCLSTDMVPGSPVAREFADLYDPENIPLPPNFHDTMEDKPRVYQRMRHQLWGQVSIPEVCRTIAHYWALCSQEDFFFGLVLDALEKSGQADNTLVLFVGDHGEHCFAHGLLHIGVPSFREIYHVPAVARWPKGLKNPGREVDALVSLADFAPTFIELAGASSPQRHTGESLAPFLRDETPPDWRDAIFSQTKGPEVYYTQRICLTKRHKYVINWFDFDELYDLEADPHEMNNLAFPDPAAQRPDFPEDGPSGEAFGQPWPRLPADLDAIRRDLTLRIWEFAKREDDIIFNQYPPTTLAPYGPFME